jgi:hypothetical protein
MKNKKSVRNFRDMIYFTPRKFEMLEHYFTLTKNSISILNSTKCKQTLKNILGNNVGFTPKLTGGDVIFVLLISRYIKAPTQHTHTVILLL